MFCVLCSEWVPDQERHGETRCVLRFVRRRSPLNKCGRDTSRGHRDKPPCHAYMVPERVAMPSLPLSLPILGATPEFGRVKATSLNGSNRCKLLLGKVRCSHWPESVAPVRAGRGDGSGDAHPLPAFWSPGLAPHSLATGLPPPSRCPVPDPPSRTRFGRLRGC